MIDIAQVQGQVHAQSVQKVGELADKQPERDRRHHPHLAARKRSLIDSHARHGRNQDNEPANAATSTSVVADARQPSDASSAGRRAS